MNWVTYEGQRPVNLALVQTFFVSRDFGMFCIEFDFASGDSLSWRFGTENVRDKALEDLNMWVTE